MGLWGVKVLGGNNGIRGREKGKGEMELMGCLWVCLLGEFEFGTADVM
jgi:hypothetical protein